MNEFDNNIFCIPLFKNKRFKNIRALKMSMKQETVIISKKEYEELLEEVGILRNFEMMQAIKESYEAKKKGVKTWELKI